MDRADEQANRQAQADELSSLQMIYGEDSCKEGSEAHTVSLSVPNEM